MLYIIDFLIAFIFLLIYLVGVYLFGKITEYANNKIYNYYFERDKN